MKAEWTNNDSLTTSQTTKAILVIDMPNNCYDCQYCRFDARKYNFRGCILTDTEVQDGTIDICKEVHSCCPLKPMPNKLDANDWHRMFGGTYEEREAKGYGWNACLEEIQK